MAKRLSRREFVLLGLLGLIVVSVWYYSDRPGGGASGATDERIAALIVGEPPMVNMDRLASDVPGYDADGRNLFKYYTPPPPPPRPVATPPPQPVARPVPTQPQPTPRPQPPRVSKPKPPPISFNYLGFLGPKDDKIAVFEDGQDLLLARAGEVVREHFRVLEFSYEAILMGYTDERFREETTELKQTKGARR